MKKEKEYNYMLISSDGGSIDTQKFKYYRDARKQMKEEFNSHWDSYIDKNEIEYSYIDKYDAYVCGIDTDEDQDCVWSIVEI